MITTIGNDWDNILEEEFEKLYFQNIVKTYNESCEIVEHVGLKVFPKKEKIFNALISILNRICGTSIALYKLLNDEALAVSHTRQTITPITA